MSVDRDHTDVCPDLPIASTTLRKTRLKHPAKLPLAICKDQEGKVNYVTHSKVTEVTRKAVKKAYPDITKKDLKQYSCHSIRVWACGTLDEAGMPPDFDKKMLRLLGESTGST